MTLSTGQGFLGYNMFAYCGNNPTDCNDQDGKRLSTCQMLSDGSGRSEPINESNEADFSAAATAYEGKTGYAVTIPHSTTQVKVQKETRTVSKEEATARKAVNFCLSYYWPMLGGIDL